MKNADADSLEGATDVVEQRNIERASSTLGDVSIESVLPSEPLTAYTYEPNLARGEEIILTVKTTLQIDKNHRHETRLKGPKAEVFGRDVSRPCVFGIVAAFSLLHDRIDWCLADSKWAFSAVEPYGVATWGDKMALAGANYVQLIDVNTGEAMPCQHPWLTQAHTVEFSADGNRLLVGSAGFDAIFEFDTASGKVVWQWFAWDHGFDRSKLGHYVVRSVARQNALSAMGHEVLLVDDPAKYEFGIPIRRRPAHLNAACYDSDEKILVTLFHQGAAFAVDRNTSEPKEVISGLSTPHKLSRRKGEGYFISDTRNGKLIFLDAKYQPEYELALAGTPGVERSPRLSEYLQNTTELREDLFASVDIHRSSLWLVDVKRRRYRGIKFPVEWSVHDVASLERENGLRIGRLVGTQFGKVGAFARRLKTIHHFSSDGRQITALILDRRGRTTGTDV
jgi:hypothetical protein